MESKCDSVVVAVAAGGVGGDQEAGGYGIFRELGRKGLIPLGGAVWTSAGRLPFRGIVHVAGISLWWRASEKSVRMSVQNAMRLVKEKGCGSVAFPLIGAGTGGKRREIVERVMVEELTDSV